ncbi:MAG: hypothetical protein B9S33_20595 [Pedosphaera sp. Tous-C6FEB]|nr:MAG: hypothetical protein B9S33_20595 [Pedosphaera sp. Tous-C6FEB]
MKKLIPVSAAIRTMLWVAAFFVGGAIESVRAAELSFNSTNSLGTNTSYIIAANDLIRFEVYKEPDLTIETRVDQDGTVSLPLVKTVRVEGRSISDAREAVRVLYEKDFLVAAHVNIVLVQSSRTNSAPVMAKPKMRFTILGQVKKPGNHEIPENESMTIVQAIATAEGFTGIAKQNSVTVLRSSNGKTEKFELDVKQMMTDSNAKPFVIKPNDIIEVRQTVF